MSSDSSLASAITQLQLISQNVNTAFGFLILALGVVGNLLNILTFSMLKNYRHNASSLYMLAKSYFDLIALFAGLFTLILARCLRIDSMATNYIWCKTRIPILYISAFNSYTCLCLQSIDTFLATSDSARWRQKSNIRTARILIIGFLCLWIAHETPYFFLQDLINSRCVSTNVAYTQYRTYAIAFGFFSAIPVSIVSIFGYLSYRHIQKQSLLGRLRSISRLTRQITRMTLFQVINVLVFTTPFAITQAYFLARASVSKDAYQQAQEQFAQLLFNVLLSGLYGVSFPRPVSNNRRLRIPLGFLLLLLGSLETI